MKQTDGIKNKRLVNLLRPIVENIVNEGIYDIMKINPQDQIIGIDYDELVVTVLSNRGEGATNRDVMQEFENILRQKIKDARSDVNDNMEMILRFIKRGH
jgi:hypothetical protein